MKLLHIEVFPTGEKIATYEVSKDFKLQNIKNIVSNDYFDFCKLVNNYLVSAGKTSTGEETKIYSFLF